MIAPAFDDRLRQHAGTSEALVERKRERIRDETLGLELVLVRLASELPAHHLDHHARGRATLKDSAALLADHLERVQPLALDLGRDELDGDAWPLGGQRPSLRNSARVRRDLLLRVVLGRRFWIFAIAEHQPEHREGELGAIFRQPLGFLADETTLEPLVFLSQE